MVSPRRVPLSRRLRAWRGQIVLGAVWAGAVLVLGGLSLVPRIDPVHPALATVQRHALRAPEGARVASVAVKPGQVVEAGAVVATLEIPGLTAELAAAEAEILAAAEGGTADALDRSRRFWRDQEAARVAVLQAKVLLEQEEAALTVAEGEVSRAETPGLGLSADELAARRGRRDQLAAAVKARRAEVASREQALAAAAARARAAGVSGEAVPAGASPALDAARAYRDVLSARLDAATLKATASGVVGEDVPLPGEWVAAGETVLSLSEPTAREAVAWVAVTEVRDIQAGAEVSVQPARGAALPGTVRSVGPAVEPIPAALSPDPAAVAYGVPVHVTLVSSVLLPGEPVSVEF